MTERKFNVLLLAVFVSLMAMLCWCEHQLYLYQRDEALRLILGG